MHGYVQDECGGDHMSMAGEEDNLHGRCCRVGMLAIMKPRRSMQVWASRATRRQSLHSNQEGNCRSLSELMKSVSSLTYRYSTSQQSRSHTGLHPSSLSPWRVLVILPPCQTFASMTDSTSVASPYLGINCPRKTTKT